LENLISYDVSKIHGVATLRKYTIFS